jgi:hypothetical protein
VARAADGDPLILGAANSETGSTTITATGADSAITVDAQSQLHGALDVLNHRGDAVWGRSVNRLGVLGNSQSGTGVKGESISSSHGVHGIAHDAVSSGVFGENDAGDGIRGESTGAGYGVHGVAHDASSAGLFGENDAGPGVSGTSFVKSAYGIGVRGGGWSVGVEGEAVATSDSIGVLGRSVALQSEDGGTGVQGEGDKTGVAGYSVLIGVLGHSFFGTGVQGTGATGVLGRAESGGTGVVAAAAPDGSGVALSAQGPAAFALSGVIAIGSGKSGTVSGVSLRPGSLVLATVQNDLGIAVESAVPDVAGSRITINLSKAVPAGKTARVAWFVVN